MIEKENSKHSVIFVNDIKNEKIKEKLNNISILIKEINDKKVNDFEELVKKIKNDEIINLKTYY